MILLHSEEGEHDHGGGYGNMRSSGFHAKLVARWQESEGRLLYSYYHFLFWNILVLPVNM